MFKSTTIRAQMFSDLHEKMDSMFFTFDLATMIENMKQSHIWKAGELNSMVLLKSDEKNIVLTAIHEGTEVSSFQKNSSLTIHILEGKIKLKIPRQSIILDRGSVFTFHDHVKYRLISKEDTVFLLTLSNETWTAGQSTKSE